MTAEREAAAMEFVQEHQTEVARLVLKIIGCMSKTFQQVTF